MGTALVPALRAARLDALEALRELGRAPDAWVRRGAASREKAPPKATTSGGASVTRRPVVAGFFLPGPRLKASQLRTRSLSPLPALKVGTVMAGI